MTPRALFHPARLARRPVLSTQSDERLVDLVRAGSEPAFETIVERYRRALMRYASRLLPPERAEDVVQQSFVKAYEAMQRDTEALNLRPWLYRIAHNTALNALRDRGLRHAELDERLDGVELPDQALERSQDLRELVVAVQALPERQRDAILLRELEGRSYQEIALALGVTDGAVRQLLNRARNSLRAAAASVTPMPMLTRLFASESAEPAAVRVAEMVGAAGSGALVAKVCATALVTGAVVGGAAVVPDGDRRERGGSPVGAEPARAAEQRPADRASSETAVSESDGGGDDEGVTAQADEVRRERAGSGDGDRSGPSGPEEPAADEDRSGPGGGGEELDGLSLEDNSGPGGGGGGEPTDQIEEASSDNSGPGGGGSGSNSGPGSGDLAVEPLPYEEPDSSGPGSGEPGY
jgi:RNA polymerase sigma factor (sigma-70 family)